MPNSVSSVSHVWLNCHLVFSRVDFEAPKTFSKNFQQNVSDTKLEWSGLQRSALKLQLCTSIGSTSHVCWVFQVDPGWLVEHGCEHGVQGCLSRPPGGTVCAWVWFPHPRDHIPDPPRPGVCSWWARFDTTGVLHRQTSWRTQPLASTGWNLGQRRRRLAQVSPSAGPISMWVAHTVRFVNGALISLISNTQQISGDLGLIRSGACPAVPASWHQSLLEYLSINSMAYIPPASCSLFKNRRGIRRHFIHKHTSTTWLFLWIITLLKT